ncbi:hypothetical protein GF337_00340 [candidate division KSB1 bacterium]|nr:hypothetical protein [candidate division KSB1 bacterium]
MFERIKRIFWLWQQCFKSMKKVKTFIPFALYATVQFGILVSLVNFVNPPFVAFYVPLIRNFFGEWALHYPTFFYILTPLFNQLNFVLSGVVGSLMIGVATHVFAYNFMRDKISIRIALRRTFSKYPTLFTIWIVESLLTMSIIIGMPYIMDKFLHPAYPVLRIIEMIALLIGIVITSIFAYATAYIVLSDQSVLRSIFQTFATFKQNMLTTFVLVAVPTLIYMPISYVAGKANVIIAKFSPEMIATVLGIGILVSFLTNYFQINTITRFYILLNDKK